MKAILGTILSILFNVSTFAQSSESPRGVHDNSDVTLSHMFSEGKSTLFKMTRSEAMKLPEWAGPGSGQSIPLPLDAAVHKGKESLKKRHPKMDDFEVTEVSLSEVGFGMIPQRWFYRVECEAVLEKERLRGRRFAAVVLMDGSVVEPIITEDTRS
jgi:hypothetical protein